ncbi:MAG TPA: VOC family protein [Kofleriaceae bacterium]|nr:VOC family protein [Kofleriaceae bacterium]
MANTFCHIELGTENPRAARDFYSKLFDWKFEDTPMPQGDYTMIKTGEGPGGGLMQKQMPEAPTAWLPYVQVASVEATVERARKLGATIVVDTKAIPSHGTLAVLLDPTGAALGIWEPAR